MRKFVFVAAMLVAVLMLVPASQAVTLSDLTSGGSITVGDKVFFDFTCQASSSGGGISGGDCNATVTGITDGSNVGIRVNDFFIAAGLGSFATVDVAFTYDVSTLSGAATIHDINMNFNASVPLPNSVVSIDEKVCAGDVLSPCGSPVGDISVTRDSSGLAVLSAHEDLSSLESTITVFKDIGLVANATGNVSFSILDQTFSQVGIPEPGSITLLGGALLGCAAIVRRRTSKRA
jgi:hypothetical protein